MPSCGFESKVNVKIKWQTSKLITTCSIIRMNSLQASHNGPVVFFDGYCNLCNRSVLFIIRNDATPTLYFASMQSRLGKEVLQHEDKLQKGDGLKQKDRLKQEQTLNWVTLQNSGAESLILVEDGKEYRRSDAALRISRYLRSPWKYLWYARYVPRPIRDAVYSFIARHRYRVFGKRESCYVPTTELRHRFLDN